MVARGCTVEKSGEVGDIGGGPVEGVDGGLKLVLETVEGAGEEVDGEVALLDVMVETEEGAEVMGFIVVRHFWRSMRLRW